MNSLIAYGLECGVEHWGLAYIDDGLITAQVVEFKTAESLADRAGGILCFSHRLERWGLLYTPLIDKVSGALGVAMDALVIANTLPSRKKEVRYHVPTPNRLTFI